jgi:hypothetical protein
MFTEREHLKIMNMARPHQIAEAALAAVPREQATLQAAFEALTRTTGLQAQVEHTKVEGIGADALVRIRAPDRELIYAAEVKRVDRRVVLNELAARAAKHPNQRFLLVTPYLTPELAQHCRQLRLPFVDTAGNVYLEGPRLLVLVVGQQDKKIEYKTQQFRAFGATGLRTIFVLLCDMQLINANYRKIADAAGVALGTVGWVFYDLRTHGYIQELGRKRRRFTRKDKLLEHWVANYPRYLRPKLIVNRFRSPNPLWWQTAHLPEFDARWGGEMAGDKLTGYIKPQQLTIYTRGDPGKLILAHRLRPDPDGDIEILRIFWNIPIDAPQREIVHPLLVYADLMATADTRNIETAQFVYERYLAPDFKAG